MADSSHSGIRIGLIIAGIIVAAAIALICTSFADLEYHQYGFKKSKTTGSVDTSRAFRGGRHWIGPLFTFKPFDATAHRISISDLTAFTAVSKTTVTVSADVYYFLVQQDLKYLHDEYDVNYHQIMANTARATVKDGVNQYTLDDFNQKRDEVVLGLHRTLQEKLGGRCCPASVDCTENPENPVCLPNCIPRASCSREDKNLFVEIRYFELTGYEIPRDVEIRNLQALVVNEETERETYVQQAAVIRKETEQKVQQITNNAQQITANATARAALVDAQSQASYQVALTDARRSGLKLLYDQLSFSEVSYKNSFDYLRTLGDLDSAQLTVDYDSLIRGPVNP